MIVSVKSRVRDSLALLFSLNTILIYHCYTNKALGASYTIPDSYRSGVTFISDRGLSYTTPHQSGTQRSD